MNNEIVSRGELINSLSKKIDDVLHLLIPSGVPCALLEFPDYANAGDSAIWLGEREWLRRNGNPVVYTCGKKNYSQKILADQVGDGIILLQGGGNFGDLWLDHQHFREMVISDFPHNKIIQLPQTFYFKQRDTLERSAKIINAHNHLILLCRDKQTFDFAVKEFSVQSILCPDMAFVLGRMERVGSPQTDIVWLSRTDKETLNKPRPVNEPGIKHTDWLKEPDTDLNKEYVDLVEETKRYPEKWLSLQESLLRMCDEQAKKRFINGCKILSEGKIVVTDRLHGHIMSLLLNIPHILMDNSYGKIRGFYETWTQHNELTLWADSPEEGLCGISSNAEFQRVLQKQGVKLDSTVNRLKRSLLAENGWTTPGEEVKRQWLKQVAQTNGEIFQVIPSAKKIILVDEDMVREELSINNKIIPFLERDHKYWGLPADDEAAITEIERLKKLNANYIVFAWPAFWCLDHYAGMNNYLVSNYKCIKRTKNIIVFNLSQKAEEI